MNSDFYLDSIQNKYAYKGTKQNRNKDSHNIEQLIQDTLIINQNIERQNIDNRTSKQFFLIGPCDVNYFQNQRRRLHQLILNYSKSAFIKYLSSNAKFHHINNLNILEQIRDQVFWEKSVPKIISYVLQGENLKSLSSKIPMLLSNNPQLIQLSKLQIFMIVISMFLCILPKQSHRSNLTFATLMGTKQKDQQRSIKLKLQKLKCFVNYLKVMSNRDLDELQKQFVNIQRARNLLSRPQLKNCNMSMKPVEIKRGFIQQQYKSCVMVDFANKNIGGGVLSNGAVQQQILFCIFPQLVSLICICEELLDNEAIIVYKIERINKYSGYSFDFKFQGTYHQSSQKYSSYESVIVAIDAIDYSKKLDPNCQYMPSQIERQIMKAVTGIQGAQILADINMPICTGRWGCGAFQGDIYLKFMIQWVACSIANRSMVYKAQDDKEERELKTMCKFMVKYQVCELIQTTEQFHYLINKIEKSKNKISFLQYLKQQI